jgi:hypothetical protein
LSAHTRKKVLSEERREFSDKIMSRYLDIQNIHISMHLVYITECKSSISSMVTVKISEVISDRNNAHTICIK